MFGILFVRWRPEPMTTTTMSIVKYRPSGSLMSPFNAFVNSFFGEDISQILGSDEVRGKCPE